MIIKIFGRIGGVEAEPPPLAAPAFHLRMPLQIVRQALRNDLPLRDEGRAFGQEPGYLILQQRGVCTGKEGGIDARRLLLQLVDILFDKIVGARLVVLVVLDQRYP